MAPFRRLLGLVSRRGGSVNRDSADRFVFMNWLVASQWKEAIRISGPLQRTVRFVPGLPVYGLTLPLAL